MDIRHTRRIYVPDALETHGVLMTDPLQAHYLSHVLRLHEGDVLRVFNGRDGEYSGKIARASKKAVEISIDKKIRPQEPEPELWLYCAPIKKIHFDNMIEKATELGVNKIQPVLTERTQIREVNVGRLKNLCREAAEQSERLSIPSINAPTPLTDLIKVFPQDRPLIVCAEWGNATPIHQAFRSPDLNMFNNVAILTGPEGGFSAAELALLRKAPNTSFVRLGPRILRADTAAIAALACWQAISGDWR